MIIISDTELLRMFGYGEDYTLEYENVIEATVRGLKKRAKHSNTKG